MTKFEHYGKSSQKWRRYFALPEIFCEHFENLFYSLKYSKLVESLNNRLTFKSNYFEKSRFFNG